MSIFDNKYTTTSTGCCLSEHLRANALPDRDLFPGERALGNLIIPPFQRNFVWSQEQQIKLIESIFLGLPIGGIVVNQASDFYSNVSDLLLDGQQRLTSIHAFINDEFPVMDNYFSDLSTPDKRFFMLTTITKNISHFDSLDLCEELYDRLAYGGSIHKPEHYHKKSHGGLEI